MNVSRQRTFKKWQVIDEYIPENGKPTSKSMQKILPDDLKNNSSIIGKETKARKFSRWSVVDKYTSEYEKPTPKDVKNPRDNSPVSGDGKEIVPLLPKEEVNEKKNDTVSLEKIQQDNSKIVTKDTRGRKFSRWSVVDKYNPEHEKPTSKDLKNPRDNSPVPGKSEEIVPLVPKEEVNEKKNETVSLEKIQPDNPKTNSSIATKETRGRKFSRWSVIDKYTSEHRKPTTKDVEIVPLVQEKEEEVINDEKKDAVSQSYVERMKLKKISDGKLRKMGHVDDCEDLRKRVIVKNTLKLLTEKPICFSELFR